MLFNYSQSQFHSSKFFQLYSFIALVFPGLSKVADAQRKLRATLGICAGHFSYPKVWIDFDIVDNCITSIIITDIEPSILKI